MIVPRPSREGHAWVVNHRGHDIRMYRSPDIEDIPASVVFRYMIHDCWLSELLQ